MSEILTVIQKDNRQAPQNTSSLGLRGESLAAEHLISSGYRIVAANFKVPVGRNRKGVQITGEIDLIAIDGDTLCFIEVKTRRSDDFAPVIASVNTRKQRQITRTAKIYRRIFGIRDIEFRYDVVTVLLPKHAKPEIDVTKGFWNETKFRKRSWSAEPRRDLF